MTPSFTADRERGMLLGVCQGLADRTETPVTLVRLGAVFLTIAGLGLPGILAYGIVGLVAPRR